MKDRTPAKDLGLLSRMGESCEDPAVVSSGKGDAGGASYGLYQMTSGSYVNGAWKDGGTVDDFIGRSPWAARFKDCYPSSSEKFKTTWKEIANSLEREAFIDAQHEYIKAGFYDPMMDLMLKKGVNLYEASLALRNVCWAAAVGFWYVNAANVLVKALANVDPKASDSVKINAIYNELTRPGKNGKGLLYWSNNSMKIQESVAVGLERARRRALDMYLKEKGQSQ